MRTDFKVPPSAKKRRKALRFFVFFAQSVKSVDVFLRNLWFLLAKAEQLQTNLNTLANDSNAANRGAGRPFPPKCGRCCREPKTLLLEAESLLAQ